MESASLTRSLRWVAIMSESREALRNLVECTDRARALSWLDVESMQNFLAALEHAHLVLANRPSKIITYRDPDYNEAVERALNPTRSLQSPPKPKDYHDDA